MFFVFPSLQIGEFLSLSLGEIDITRTPYSSLEKINICKLETPFTCVTATIQEDSGSVQMDEESELSCHEGTSDATSSENVESNSLMGTEDHTKWRPLFQPCFVPQNQPVAPDKTVFVPCQRACQSEDSPNQTNIISDYIVVLKEAMETPVHN